MTQRTRNMLVLGAMLGIFVAFAVIARVFVNPAEMDRVNRGTLIVPHVPVAALDLTTEDGQAWTGEDMAGQWSLMYIAGERCARACKNALFYLMTRLRRSLAQDSDRLRLILVHTRQPSDALRRFMEKKELAPMVELRGEPGPIRQALAPAFDDNTDPRHHLYMVAPDGQIFMWYPTHKDREALLQEADGIYHDLTRTLKGSRI